MTKLFYIALFFFILPANAGALDNEENIRLEAEFFRTLEGVENVFAPNFQDSEREIFNAIEFVIDHNDELKAFASFDIKLNKRLVILSTGLLKVIENLNATNFHSTLTPSDAKCELAYQNWIFENITAGSISLGKWLQPDSLAEKKCECVRYSKQGLFSNSSVRTGIRNGTQFGYTFVILHEIAHHIYHDVSSPTDRELDEEIRADEWALIGFKKANLPPNPVLPVLSVLLALENQQKGKGSFSQVRFNTAVDFVLEILRDENQIKLFSKEIYDQIISESDQYRKYTIDIVKNKKYLKNKYCKLNAIEDYGDFLKHIH